MLRTGGAARPSTAQRETVAELSRRNRLLVLDVIRRYGPISKPGIAHHTGLTPMAVNNIVRRLAAEQWICEGGLGPSNGGRRPVLYQVSREQGHVLVVDLNGVDVEAAVVDLRGDFLTSLSEQVELEQETPVLTVIRCISRLLERHGRHRILGIGVSSPGIVDSQTGHILHSVPLRWRDVPLGEILEQTFALPVVVGNQVQAAIKGEHAFGDAFPVDNLLYVAIDTGIGLAAFINGELHRGARAMAGELGHTLVDPNGPLCQCGNRGCLEQVASVKAFLRYAREAGAVNGRVASDLRDPSGPALTEELQRLFQLADQGHPQVSAALDRVVDHLSIALLNLIRTYDPERVLVNGPSQDRTGVLFKRLSTRVRAFPWVVDISDLPIVPSRLGRRARFLGGAAWVVESSFHGRRWVGQQAAGRPKGEVPVPANSSAPTRRRNRNR